MKELPIYEAKLTSDDDGVFCLSFVDYPATEVSWQVFKQDKPMRKFSIADEDKHIVRGVFMTANHLIYRVGVSGYEYYIKFSEEVLREMAERFLRGGYNRNVDTNHNEEMEKGIYLQELFFKDVEKGINPVGFEDVEDKSLFCQYRVENEEVWKKIKDGTYTGFSLAGYFDYQEVEDPEEQEYKECMELINKINKQINKKRNGKD